MFQGLTSGETPCLRGARLLKGGFTEIRFGTEAITPMQLMAGDGRVGLVLWLDAQDVKAARDAFAAEKSGEVKS